VIRTVRAPASHRERRLEHAPDEVDAVRRQLRNAVRDDRAREVDGLASGTNEWDFGAGSQNATNMGLGLG
jgi:hypothetical protein